MDPWINNIPLYGQNGTPVFRQLRGYSDPSNATQQQASALNCMSFAPVYHTGFTVYYSASPYENQSDPSSPSLCEPAGSTSSDNITTQTKMWLKEEVICLIETYAKKKDDFRNPRVRNKDIWSDISSEMQAQGHVTCLARPSSRISRDHILHALITTRKQETIKRNGRIMKIFTTYSMVMRIYHWLCTAVGWVWLNEISRKILSAQLKKK